MISHLESVVDKTGCGGPPSSGTSRMEPWSATPLTYAIFFPSGDQTGKFPSCARRRGGPPRAGAIQMSPPYVRYSKPIGGAILMRPVREERVETKAMEAPSGENAGW